MHALWPFALNLAAPTQTDWRGSYLRQLRRDGIFANTSIATSSTVTSSVTSSTTLPAFPSGTTIDTSIPILPPFFPTNVSNSTETCTGAVTYYGSAPPTVYVTVTEGYNVTLTASNASITEEPTFITPLPACEATIVPLAASFGPALLTVESSTSAAPESFVSTPSVSVRPLIPLATPEILSFAPLPAPLAPAGASQSISEAATPVSLSEASATASLYSSAPYTSTVIVTKKTPVPVVVPPTTSPDVNFNIPSQTPTTPSPPPPGPPTSANNGGADGGAASIPQGSSKTASSASQTGNNGGGGSGPPSPTPDNPGANPTPSPAGNGPASTDAGGLVVPPATTRGLGNIIASIINSPFLPASGASSFGGAVPATTIIDQVPVTVFASSIIIGGAVLSIPTSTTIVVSGVSFIVQPSQVVAPGTTYTISTLNPDQLATTIAPSAKVVTVDGIPLTVGSTAVIISGTTIRIGPGAPETSVVVGAATVLLGPNGVVLPVTTVPAGAITDAPFVVLTADGLILSVDGSEAIISGTTYRIGSNAPQLTTVIGSQTVSLGPNGIGLATTTIPPTTVHTITAKTGSKSSAAGPSSTGTTGLPNRALSSSCLRMPFLKFVAWMVTTVSLPRVML